MTIETVGVDVYSVGLVYASVCVREDMPVDEVEASVNEQHPTGLESRWRVSEDTHFATGQEHPCPCGVYPGKVHRLLSC